MSRIHDVVKYPEAILAREADTVTVFDGDLRALVARYV